MFDNSVSVLASVSKSLKKYLFILGIVTQCLFIAYYTYLVITNIETIPLVILYSPILFFAIVLLFIDIFTVDITSFKTINIKIVTKRIINGLSWLFKAGVISYNIYLTTTRPVTEASKMFLIFSSVFLIVQIISSLFGWLLSYYSDLFLYAIKMDYENLIDEDTDSSQRPIGQALNKFTKQKDYKSKVNELSVKHELFGSIKDELEKEKVVKINGKVIKRKKAERIALLYYRKANKYYPSSKKTKSLIDFINLSLTHYLYQNDKAFLLDFFLENHYEHKYVGLSEHAVKLIIACFLFVLDNNNKDIISVVYKALLKEIIDIKSWSAPTGKEITNNNLDIQKALEIAKETKTQYELYKDETVGSEFESLVFKLIKDTAIENGRIMIKRQVRKFFKKDK